MWYFCVSLKSIYMVLCNREYVCLLHIQRAYSTRLILVKFQSFELKGGLDFTETVATVSQKIILYTGQKVIHWYMYLDFWSTKLPVGHFLSANSPP